MVDFCIAKAAPPAPMTYGDFIQRPTSQPLRNPDLIDKHYSARALERGRTEFAPPDLKPLPDRLK